MKPIPSTLMKTYQSRGPLQQFRFTESVAFRCFRCGNTKKSKLITVYNGDWSRKLCNGCYGLLLSIYKIKAGTVADDERAEQLAEALFVLTTTAQQREAERAFRVSHNRGGVLSSKTRQFIATAEYVAAQLKSTTHLEWSPAVLGLCKAVELEILNRVVIPLAALTADEDLEEDERDKDIGGVAAFCSAPHRKPPELGKIEHFLQTVIHSRRRRQTSTLIGCFLRLAAEWAGSSWFLAPDGLYRSLTSLRVNFRNRAAHIDELTKDHYIECRELVVGTHGIIWNLVTSTERQK